MSEEQAKSEKLPPRVHCFGGPRVDLNDICNKSDECRLEECLWHREKGSLPSSLGVDDNRTEAMPKIG